MFLTTFIFIVTILSFPSPLTGQNNLTLLDRRTLPPETRALILEGNMVGYWGRRQVVLQNNHVPIPENEQFINVLPFNNKVDDYLLIITTENSSVAGTVTVNYRLMDPAGLLVARWSQTQSNDVGLPEIHLVSDYFLFLHPEDQTVAIISLSGEQISQQSLFPNSVWNQERKLTYLPNKEGKSGLVGMASADLTDPQNTHLFQVGPDYLIQLKASVPLTMPYFTELSAEDQLFIIGTQAKVGPEDQVPYLWVYNSQYQPLLEFYRLKAIPYFAHWWQGNVLMIFQDDLSLIAPDSPQKEKTISTDVNTFPLYSIVEGNMCYLFTSDKIQYQSQNINYAGLRCNIIDLQTGISQTQTLTPTNYKQIVFFPPGNEKILGIQLNEQVYFYDLK